MCAWRRQLLNGFAVQDYVQTHALVLFSNTKAHDHVDNLQQDEADHAAVDQRSEYALGLQENAAIRAADVLDANTPVRIAPMMPPTPCTPKASSAVVIAEQRASARWRPK
jgi:hypothetical protein